VTAIPRHWSRSWAGLKLCSPTTPQVLNIHSIYCTHELQTVRLCLVTLQCEFPFSSRLRGPRCMVEYYCSRLQSPGRGPGPQQEVEHHNSEVGQTLPTRAGAPTHAPRGINTPPPSVHSLAVPSPPPPPLSICRRITAPLPPCAVAR
jgi:hypothetical protein